MKNIERDQVLQIEKGLRHRVPLIHIITGPRQVGKTTASLQIAGRWKGPVIQAAADIAPPPMPEWIEMHWLKARQEAGKKMTLLILDEIQKVKGWSDTVKRLWDEDRKKQVRLKVLLLGSSSLLIQKGLSETMAGRFFIHPFTHWSYSEMKQAFGWNVRQWIFYGGYPGAAGLVNDEAVWRQYVADSLIETVLVRDIFQLQTITKPALFRNLFGLASAYPAQIFSYNKMLGQLQEAGNTTTLAHYLKLLESAYLVSGLEQFRMGKKMKRGSSPKIILWNNALSTALGGEKLNDAGKDSPLWGRLVENAVGAHFLNSLRPPAYYVYYWRERNREVDFVIQAPRKLWAVEVKSGKPASMQGMSAFKKTYPQAKPLIVGSGGISLEDFFSNPAEQFLV